MKANIRQNVISIPKDSSPFHGHALRLTVGMIVKDEEKNLVKCLEALKPLLNAVPSELIITDTGSTDRTVEIAKQYTDHILHLEWCGDFSAARNTGLDAARGEWFFFVDADEWFDDVTPIIEFFNSGDCDQYNSASYIQRNYNDLYGNSHSDARVFRAFRRLQNVHFENRVHEEFPCHLPLKMLDTFVHHYGYVYNNEEARRKKYKRNEELLESELKTDPNDLKAILQYTGQIVEKSPEKAARLAMHGLEIAREKDPENCSHLLTRFGYHLIMADLNCHRYADVFSTAEEALKHESSPCIFHLEIYRLCQIAAWEQKNYAAVIKYGSLYRELYPDYRDGKLDLSLLVLDAFRCLTPEESEKSQVMSGMAWLKLDNNGEAQKCLESLSLTAETSLQNGSLNLCTDLSAQAADWGISVEFYRRVIALGDEKKAEMLLAHLNGYYANFPSEQRAMALAFSGMKEDGAWILLCRLRAAEQEDNREQAAAVLAALCQRDEQWSASLSDILWYAIKEKKNLVPFLSHIDVDGFPAMAEAMQAAHEDYSSTLGWYFDTFSFQDAKALFISSCLLERAVLSRNARENHSLYRKLTAAYLENLSRFVHAVYRPEILTPSGLSALPQGFRFGFYAGKALEAKHTGDSAGYLKHLRAGLNECPAMKDCVAFLLEYFDREQKENDSRAQEFSELAKQVKYNIEQLITQGDLKQAGVYTLQLAKLIPEDDDLRRYRRLTHTELTMSEIASHLPQ